MLFSVIVPVYNMERHLPRCLDSLAGQTCADKEVILVDDGSTDSSGALCDEYATRYGFFSVIHQDNQGLSAARNAGLAAARGEWLAFVNADEWVDTGMLELLQGCFLATNADLFRLGLSRESEDCGADDAVRQAIGNRHSLVTLHDAQALLRYCLQSHLALRNVSGYVYRHRTIREYGLSFENMRAANADDILFNLQYLLHTHKVLHLADKPYHSHTTQDQPARDAYAEQTLLHFPTLGELVYQAIAKEHGNDCLRGDFHRLYFFILDTHIRLLAADMDDTSLRRILDKMWKNKLHRHMIRQARKDRLYEGAKVRAWFDKSFGRKGRSPVAWALWLLVQRARFAVKDNRTSSFPYLMDKQHRVAYLVNYKAACSTIQVSMMHKNGIPDDYSIFSTQRPIVVRNKPIPRGGNWFTFSFVRNPFARLVSCYESKYHEDRTKNAIAVARGFFDFDYYLGGYMKEDKGFAHFLRQVISIPHQLDDGHFVSQYRRLVDADGQPVVDFIGKVESMQEDYEPIRKRCGYDPLLHYNKSGHGDWRDYYTTPLAEAVYRKYKKDVLYFGYEREYQNLLEHCARRGV